MNVVIVGAGEVGSYLSQVLSDKGHDVTVIEADSDRAQAIDEAFNVRVIHGNGGSAQILKKANVDSCHFFLPMTSDDKTNLIASSIAKALGARTVITRIHDQTYQDTSHVNYQVHFGIDFMINPEALCALELAKSIRNPARVAVENFARGQIEAQRLVVDEKAKLLGKTLREIKLPPTVRFGYYQRGDQQDIPSADYELQAGDIVTVFGPPNELYKIRSKLDPRSAGRQMRVTIFGGGETAVALIRLLSDSRFKVQVIEQQGDKCQRLAERFPNVTFIQGDGTSLRLMEEEQVGHADHFVASTSEDERNIMTAMQAAKLGAKAVQSVTNKSDYEEILNNLRGTLGISALVSPRKVTANEVIRYISKEPYIELFQFPQQSARILEIRVEADSPAAGKSLREIGWPKHAVVVALLHKFQVKVPGAEDRILGGDRLVVITREENIDNLLKLFRNA